MPQSMYASFGTDPKLEKKGVWVDYGVFRVLLARAGGSNTKFQRLLEAKTKPYRFAIEKGLLPNEKAEDLYLEAFCEGVVLDWQIPDTSSKDGWKSGIEAQDGGTLDVTLENKVATLKALPELFKALSNDANSATIYRQQLLEEDAKN